MKRGGEKKKNITRSLDIFISVITIFEACPPRYLETWRRKGRRRAIKITRLFVDIQRIASPWKVNFRGDVYREILIASAHPFFPDRANRAENIES